MGKKLMISKGLVIFLIVLLLILVFGGLYLIYWFLNLDFAP